VPRIVLNMGRALLLLSLAGLLLYGLGQLRTQPPWSDARVEETLSWQRVRNVHASVTLGPSRGHVEGVATLRLEWQGPEAGNLYFLLNPGLSVSEVTQGETVLHHTRRNEALHIAMEQTAPEFDITIRYAGALSPETPHTAHVEVKETLLPAWSWWYPSDPHSAYAFHGELNVPQSFEAIGAGVLDSHRVENGRRIVAWREARPVFGASIAAGAYDKATRWQGKLWTSVYWPEDEVLDPAPLLEAVGAYHQFYRNLYGDDEFTTVNIVLSPELDFPFHGVNSTLFLPYPLSRMDDWELALARLMARNWWGATVTARWFTSRPEAGAWLVEGLTVNSADRAFRQRHGLDGLTALLEARPAFIEAGPHLKNTTLQQFWQLSLSDRDDFSHLAGAMVRLIETSLGETSFDAACRQLLRTHRHATLSSAALQHELEAASGQSLDGFFAQWFDSPGMMDYGIQQVVDLGDQVRINIQNLGDIPMLAPVQLAIISDAAFELHTLEAPAHATEISLPLRGSLQSVVLDPYLKTPDQRRSNNLFPRRYFPTSFAVDQEGVHLQLADSPWRPGAFATRTLNPQLESVGPFNAPKEQSARTADGLPEGVEVAVPLREGPEGMLAWRDEAGRVLGVDSKQDAPEEQVLAEGVSAFAWDPNRPGWLVVFDRNGSLLRRDAFNDETEVLLDRQRPVVQAEIASNGGHVAWLETSGLLRIAAVDTPIPHYATTRGEVLDFSWDLEGAHVYVLTRETKTPLRSPSVAAYRLSALRPDGTSTRHLDLAPIMMEAAEPHIHRAPLRPSVGSGE